IVAPFDYPPFDRAAMDGYAVKVQDTYSATKDKPVLLRIAGEVQAGTCHRFRLVSGNCFSVMTGSKLPEGTDAVIKIEDVETADSYIKVFFPVKKDENISFKSEDLSKGKIVIRKGTFIDSAVVMMLAYLGKAKIKVMKQPDVSIVVTGDELIEPGNRLSEGKVYDSNSYGLYALVKESGCVPHIFGIAQDKESHLHSVMKMAIDCDVMLVSGGVSTGKYDLVINVLREMGIKTVFWKVAMKPGKPVFFGKKDNTLVFGLPGYPVSTYLSFCALVKVALKKMLGFKNPDHPFVYGILTSDIRNDGDRTALFRVKVISEKNGNFVYPYHKQKSGMLSSVVETNGLLVVRKGLSLKTGDLIKCEILRERLLE
ncbi:MAG: molybdopterin molybdotransferase MoeA, partial [Candidatus Omnitrophica bacterium]|nr:molybdopterin molybdotransferase MoeA [Candidatus Omnitrophota bacterium]